MPGNYQQSYCASPCQDNFRKYDNIITDFTGAHRHALAIDFKNLMTRYVCADGLCQLLKHSPSFHRVGRLWPCHLTR